MRRYFAKEDWQEEEHGDLPVEVSVEEAELMEEEANETAAEINEEVAEAERMLDVADSLEDMAVVVDQIEEATPAETQLVQVAGDLATAGSDEVDASDVVPATESYVGRRIASEGFVKKAEEIWERIKQWLMGLWAKVEKFFYNIFGAVSREIKKLDALEKRVGEAKEKGYTLDNDKKTITLTSGLGVLTVGGVVVTNQNKFLPALERTSTTINNLLNGSGLVQLGKDLKAVVEGFKATNQTDAHAKLVAANSKIENTLASTARALGLKQQTSSRWPNKKVQAATDLLNGKALVLHTEATDPKASAISNAEAVRNSGLEFTYLGSTEAVAPKEAKFTTMSLDEMTALIKANREVLTVLDDFHRKSGRKDMNATNKDLIKACDKQNKEFAKSNESEELASYGKALFKYGAMYSKISVTPMMQAHDLGLMSVRAANMLIARSLACYLKG